MYIYSQCGAPYLQVLRKAPFIELGSRPLLLLYWVVENNTLYSFKTNLIGLLRSRSYNVEQVVVGTLVFEYNLGILSTSSRTVDPVLR